MVPSGNTYASRPAVRGILIGILVAMIAVVVGPVALGLVNSTPLCLRSEQTASAPVPVFEVASIKFNRSPVNRLSIWFPPGRFMTIGTPAESLIKFAYSLQSDSQILGGPKWIRSDRFDVEAKIEDSAVEKIQKLPWTERSGPIKLMLQSLLADRFDLTGQPRDKRTPRVCACAAKEWFETRPSERSELESPRRDGAGLAQTYVCRHPCQFLGGFTCAPTGAWWPRSARPNPAQRQV
jgi:Protein of unknown function (DUF3738)